MTLCGYASYMKLGNTNAYIAGLLEVVQIIIWAGHMVYIAWECHNCEGL